MALAACLAAATPAVAEPHCYRADANSGELLFDGVLEGTPFTGRFRLFTVELCMETQDLSTATIRVVVDTGSGDTGNRQGNAALRDEAFFHVARYPEGTWTSTSIRTEGDAYLAEGTLTIRNISASVPVRLQLQPGDPPQLSGEAQLLRLDFQVGTGEFEDTEFLRNRVDLRFRMLLEPVQAQ
jgi:polyisoprenoid-binding protein YceI